MTLKNKTAVHTFLVLFTCSLLILFASTIVFTQLFNPLHLRVNNSTMAKRLAHVAKVARRVPKKEWDRLSWLADYPGVTTKIIDSKEKNVDAVDPDELLHWLNRHPGGGNFLIRITDHRDLYVSVSPLSRYPSWLWWVVIIVGATIVTLLALLCIWTIRRLYFPADELAGAVKKLGQDVNSPPLNMQGSQAVQDVCEAFNQMQERLKKLISDRTQMVAAISHDLRTPITRLKLRAEYLEGTNQYFKFLADLREMEAMVDDVLAFSRDDMREEVMQRFDLNALLDSLCDDLCDAGFDVKYHSKENKLSFHGRINALKRALMNLIVNAATYGKKATVSLDRKDNEVMITIDDQGPGIPDEEKSKVFEPFYRSDKARSLETGGSGLGMVIAKEVIKAHGGQIRLFNRSHGGLRVLVQLQI